jgi:hypothetical protein
MITYLYWALVFGLALAFVVFLGRADKWKVGLIGSAVVLVIGWGAYFFHFQQVFVKHYGGVMSISVPKGQYHVAATWKEDHLWVENYDPKTNTCHFNEYSKGNLLQGKVHIKNCNPLLPGLNGNSAAPAAPTTK